VSDTVLIPRRFNGPPDTGHGGYSAAMAAQFVDGPAEVTLRLPPPLDAGIAVEHDGAGRVRLVADGMVVMEASRTVVDDEPPLPVTLEEAAAAVEGSPWWDDHPFPTCFACGPDREPGDGLRLCPGPLGDGRWAVPWTPDRSLADSGGAVREAFVWAALDCPSAGPVEADTPAVLARMAVRIDAPVRAGERHVIVSARVWAEGRKSRTVVALYTAGGELLAAGRALWIALREAA
jgi:acyl-coenzyme A thioesterase PaaI-like protein